MTEKRFGQTGLDPFFGSPIYERLVPRDHPEYQTGRAERYKIKRKFGEAKAGTVAVAVASWGYCAAVIKPT